MRVMEAYSLAILELTSSLSLSRLSAPSVLAKSSLSSGRIGFATSLTLTSNTASLPARSFCG